MDNTQSRLGAPEWLILIGASLFVVVLAVSAVWEADIRWLHFFQAWMYLATIFLALRRNRWGYFVGISTAGLWDYSGLFVNTFVRSGLRHLATSISTGQLSRPDQIIAIPAWGSNFLVIAGCLWGYGRLRKKTLTDLGLFLIAFGITTGFFALDMALFQPRYLGLFPALLHPHAP
jgi:hypothetical protein